MDFARAMRESHPRLPLAFNYSSSFKWSNDPNPFLFRELGELGYKFIFITLYAAHAGMYAVWNALEDLVKNQEQAQWTLEQVKAGHPTESHHVMARVSHFQELERRYIPGADERISSSAGRARRPLARTWRAARPHAPIPAGLPTVVSPTRSNRGEGADDDLAAARFSLVGGVAARRHGLVRRPLAAFARI